MSHRHLLLFTFSLVTIFSSSSWSEDSTTPVQCSLYTEEIQLQRCKAAVWCPACNLNQFKKEQVRLVAREKNFLDVLITSKKKATIGSLTVNGDFEIRNISPSGYDTEVCPSVTGSIVVAGHELNECVPLTKGRAMSFQIPKNVLKVLGKTKYSVLSVFRSQANTSVLKLGSIRIEEDAKICGVQLASRTKIVFDGMEQDDSFSIRPTEPFKIDGTEYPAFLEGKTFYEIFDGTKCNISMTIAGPGEEIR
ncbi:MAG: hypothetical protein IPJ84_15065 [Bdellovibrionales bacterium]|nr:hypothetical protein [Bdellovibrionales bacterium]